MLRICNTMIHGNRDNTILFAGSWMLDVITIKHREHTARIRAYEACGGIGAGSEEAATEQGKLRYPAGVEGADE